MSSTKDTLLDLFDRPNEPIFTPKGDKGVIFNVPDDYLNDRFKDTDVVNRFGAEQGAGDRIPVKPITLPDSINIAKQLPKDELFSLFIPYHRRMAGKLIEIFVGAQNLEDLVSIVAYCRGAGNVNSALLNYALNVAVLNRNDTKDLEVPPLAEYFPQKYVDGQVMRRAREEAKITNDGRIEPVPLEIPMDYTASDLDEEHRVAYFREDIGINLHHWHWHLVYPFNGPTQVINKDRRGELFYYMHQQIVARYNAERFSNKLPRVTRFLDLRGPIEEGYFPKLDSISSSRIYAARTPNTTLRDVNRAAEQIRFDILDLERWRDRLYEAVQSGRILDSRGNSVPLTDTTGIDILGNLIESSDLSMNRNVYGDLHNLGHVAISFSHDPDHRHLETFSVMGDSATAMRDPIFYRWHAFIDDIFQNYKRTLRPYTSQELTFNGVQVSKVEVVSQGGPSNTFRTNWQKSDVNLTRGLDFSPRSNVFARFTHLQHNPFEYKITVNNNGPARQGTVRIFIAPKFDERGLPFLLNEQRLMMIELDKFVANLSPNQNVITRRSNESSVTIPFGRTFRNLETTSTGSALSEFNYCGCGWPEHMLIPKGSTEGFVMVLFVMITNFDDDKVEERRRDNVQCRGAVSYCGLRDSKYPDKKPMGFPFDRQPIQSSSNAVIDTLQQFLTPNMGVQDVKIVFTNKVELRTPSAGGQRPGNKGGQSGNSQQATGGNKGGQSNRLTTTGGTNKPNRPASPNRRN